MKTLYLYTGKGAYQAKDIENLFGIFDIEYRRICEHKIKELKNNNIFIVPGGAPSWYLEVLSISDKKNIRKFIKNGGVYIGICAGAYIAGKKYNGKSGLNLINDEFKHQKSFKIVKCKDKVKNEYNLILENGPLFNADYRNKDILLTGNDGRVYAMEFKYGNGRIILFSAHPEGSIYYKKDPRNFSGVKFFLSLLNKNI